MEPGVLVVSAVYWLAASAWFGAALYVVVGLPGVHRVIEQADPTLGHVLSVNLEGRHAALLSGQVAGELLRRLGPVELACLAALAVAQAGEWLVVLGSGGGGGGGGDVLLPLVRTALLTVAGASAAYGVRSARPRARRRRERYVEVADEPDEAAEEQRLFLRDQSEVTALLTLELFALAGVVLFAAAGLGGAAGRVFTFG